MKSAVYVIKFFQSFADTGFRGKITAKFFAGLLKLIKPRAKKMNENLKLVYPESSEEWRREIISKVYENLAWTLTETLALQRDHSQAFQWVKKFNKLEFLEKFIDEKQGVIFLTCHLGNWELFGSWFAQYEIKRGHELHVVYQETHDMDISNYIRETREKGSMRMMSKDVSVIKMAHMLKNGAHIAVLNDVSGTNKMKVPFMGVEANNIPGPAIMALLTGVPVIPLCLYRIAPFEHEAEVLEPIKIPDKNLNHEERVRLMVLEMNKSLEKLIKKKPEQWFWLHNRWKK